MAIKLLGGLSAENFAGVSPERIDIQRVLFSGGFVDGFQIRVGHEHTNRLPAADLISRISDLRIPYIVHGPAENFGVDMGLCYDECGKYEEFQKIYPEVGWPKFNKEAIETASSVAYAPLSLDRRIVLHPGYSRISRTHAYRDYIKGFLGKDIGGTPVSLEAVPAFVMNDVFAFYGFGGMAQDMVDLLGDDVYNAGRVLIDFTHVGVTANQMAAKPGFFGCCLSYEELIEEFLALGVSRFCHFSGHTKELHDVHGGFIDPATHDDHKRDVVKDSFAKLDLRFSPDDVYVALEIKFDDLDRSKREIEAFRGQYLM